MSNMGNRIRRNVIVFVAFLLVMYSFVYADTINMLVFSTVQQEKSNWCWAASAENCARAFMTNPKTQSEAVNYVKGTASVPYPNVTANLQETAAAATYVCHGAIGFSYTACSLTSGVKSYDYLKGRIDANRPPILGAGYYSGSTMVGGHMVLMDGYYSSSSASVLRYTDPADNCKYSCTYEAFKDGSYNGRKYNGTVWRP